MSKTSDASQIETKIEQISERDHIRMRPMWAGAHTEDTHETIIINEGKLEQVQLCYAESFAKIIDEIITNAGDQAILYPKLVKIIKAQVLDDGTIVVENDGTFIETKKVKSERGKEMYAAQMAFTEFRAGTNFENDEDRITGGQNGLGAKITVVLSKKFTIETCDSKNKLLFKQTYLDGMSVIEPAEVTPCKNKAFTRITFLPDYAHYKVKVNEFLPTVKKLVEIRMASLACYTGLKCEFNGQQIYYPSLEKFVNLTEYCSTTVTGQYKWQVIVSKKEQLAFSIVNCIVLNKGGTHIEIIFNQLFEGMKPLIDKITKDTSVKYSKDKIAKHISIYMMGAIPNPKWQGQVKNALTNTKSEFASYVLPQKFINDVFNMIADDIMDDMVKKATSTKGKRIRVAKYEAAKYAGGKDSRRCGLIVSEGDSANGMVQSVLGKSKDKYFNQDWFGTLPLQGVIPNALKEAVEKKTKDGVKILPGDKIKENKHIASIVSVVGLQYEKTYDQTPSGNKDFGNLNYGFIAALTDQDLDGFNIFGLLATFISTHWPELMQRNFLRRFITPLIRAYPKRHVKIDSIEDISKLEKNKAVVLAFYNDADFRIWESKNDISKYEIKYYKGLSSHSGALGETGSCFKNIDDKLIIILPDVDANENIQIYYGPETKNRKTRLSQPVDEEIRKKASLREQKKALSLQLCCEVQDYQRDNILRKLLCFVDGFVLSRRIVYYNARKSLSRKEEKVASFSGEILKNGYHHGEASIASTITNMAQSMPGARNFPVLLPIGNFGTRKYGYKDPGEPRYISTKLNRRLMEAMFREEDNYLLDYETVDGKIFAPKYYMPIIPRILLENDHMPGTGWVMEIYARDWKQIFEVLTDMIKGKIHKCPKLIPDSQFNHCEVRHVNKKGKATHYFVAKYSHYVECGIDHIKITDLPPEMYSNSIAYGSKTEQKSESYGFSDNEHVDEIDDRTTDEQVDLTIKLKPGSFQTICKQYGDTNFDAIETYFDLKSPINNHINLTGPDGEVKSFECYEDVFSAWYEMRKKAYGQRLIYEEILLKARLDLLQNIQRFNREYKKYGISTETTLEQCEEILTKNNYCKFNKTLLDNPKYVKINELKEVIYSKDVSYDYLINLKFLVDMTKSAYDKREEQIRKLTEQIAFNLSDNDTKMFRGAKTWLKELDFLRKEIDIGIATAWFYGENIYNHAE